ncbi:hypothetical protein [Pseudoalteromonas sp. OOF1S-7]|uniref:hypothetical protein n=1 Tax=Pseudoalteromonas sp. OOF1S-7 TaxID=2917757 RepID=UPI001EF4C84A|nr:hypothetical protein [Pseudoalteromonas sp. OOF1S-7]MCG7534583.1 hypothetical protein [Pseudoalteromonas sp. OOF1S-7]
MQLSHSHSIPEQYHKRTQAGKSAQPSQDGSEVSADKSLSIRLEGKQNLTYLLKSGHIRVASEEEMNRLNQDMHGLTLGAKDLAVHYQRQGQQQDMRAMIKIDGQVMAYLRDDGSFAGHKGVEDLFRQAGGDIKKLQSLVEQQYPRSGEVEVFESGEGPTNAEVFELFNGRSFQVFIKEQVASRKETEYTQQLAQDEAYRRKLMFDQSPQTAVFRVGGVVVGSMDEKGFADVGQALTALADERGVERAQLKSLFTLDFDRTPDEYKALLSDVFGDDVQLDTFTVEQAPSRAEVRRLSQ